ncbi:dihydroorotate dehydrogenase electron transfer subunit [Candidatus Woesearchaeota archaeon]|nr:dihydroorotate dehydrogenase electron transfer subunit [Candidatus Woesearchaeota archaeon]
METNCSCKTDVPRVMTIHRILEEGKGQCSFFFKSFLNGSNKPPQPGQFVMVWLPGVDEKPMAISYSTDNEFAFTAQSVGPFTQALTRLKRGDRLGIRGPYGKGFTIKNPACVVAGGVGIASVATLIDQLQDPLIIYGTRSKAQLIYLQRYKKQEMLITTDDGSHGKKGFTTDVLVEVLSSNKTIKMIYTCGPEIMMKKVVALCMQYMIPCEASLERYMSCGFGVCGKCMVNDKITCIDGPVFSGKVLSTLSEFGATARLKSGRKVSLAEHHKV